jgi:two-component system phosphate regulon response regulator PhoB
MNWLRKLFETPASRMPVLGAPQATVLVVDPSLTIQKVLELTFDARSGFCVASFSDGLEASRKLLDLNPEIVIAAVKSPGVSGIDLCRQIRATASMASVPVLLLKGTFERIDQPEAMAAGANAIVTKPFDSCKVREQTIALVQAFRTMRERGGAGDGAA